MAFTGWGRDSIWRYGWLMVHFNQMCTSRLLLGAKATLTSLQLQDQGRDPCRVVCPTATRRNRISSWKQSTLHPKQSPQKHCRNHRHHSLAAATWESSEIPVQAGDAYLSVLHAAGLGQVSTRSRGCYYIFSPGFLTAKTSKRQTPNTPCCCCSSVRCALN